MEATTPRSPSQTSSYERGYPYTHPSTYPSPAKTEGDASGYMTEGLGLYSYTTMTIPSHSIHPAQTLYPLSPHPSEATWTPSMAANASPSMIEGQPLRTWEPYESVARSPMPSWEAQFPYAASGSFVETRHSPAPSDGHIISQRSSVSSSYDHSLYSQDGSESTFPPQVKLEPQNEWMSDEDSMMCQQPLTVSPERLGKLQHVVAQSEEGEINTSTARTRSRSATTKANANYECHQCGKLFQRSYNHKAHMETHDPERPHPNVCQTKSCGRAFVRRTDLVRHEQSVHVKARNHRCKACDASFARKDTLRRHTEDGCPKRFEVMGKQAQREASGRRGSALPMSHHGLPPHHQAHSQHMSSLGHSTPYFQPEAFPPSPQ